VAVYRSVQRQGKGDFSEVAVSRFPKASSNSVRYLDILFNDVGIGTHKAKLAYIHNRFDREEIHGTSDLYQFEASLLIDQLKEQKTRHAQASKADDDEE
jgi:hypothetical protein